MHIKYCKIFYAANYSLERRISFRTKLYFDWRNAWNGEFVWWKTKTFKYSDSPKCLHLICVSCVEFSWCATNFTAHSASEWKIKQPHWTIFDIFQYNTNIIVSLAFAYTHCNTNPNSTDSSKLFFLIPRPAFSFVSSVQMCFQMLSF